MLQSIDLASAPCCQQTSYERYAFGSTSFTSSRFLFTTTSSFPAMFATAIHAPLPTQAAHYFGATLFEASGVIRRGAADGGLPSVSHAEIKKGLQLCKIALDASEGFEDTLLDATKEQLAQHAVELRTFANTGAALKDLYAVLEYPRSAIDAQIAEMYKPLITQFVLVHDRIEELAQMAEHLAAAPTVDEDSESFGSFLTSIGKHAIAC